MILGLDAWIFWLLLAIVLLIIEAVTTRLTTIWPAAGSLAALVLDLLRVDVIWQIIIMLLLSMGLLLLYRLFFQPRTRLGGSGSLRTNESKLLGAEALVIEKIDPVDGSGLIRAFGQVWRAGSSSDEVIEKGASVVIVTMHGVRAIVRPK